MTAYTPAPTLTHWRPRVGPPDVAGPLAVFPLFGPHAARSPTARSPGRAAGRDRQGDAGRRLGERPRRAQPDRPAGAALRGRGGAGRPAEPHVRRLRARAGRRQAQVPVSCVEHGRWDGARHGEAVRPAPQAAYPDLRRRKNAALRARRRRRTDARATRARSGARSRDKAARLAARPADRRDARRLRAPPRVSSGDLRGEGRRCTTGRSARWPRSAGAASCSTASAARRLRRRCTARCCRATRSTRWTRPPWPAPPHDAAEAFAAAVRAAAVDVRDGIGLGRFARFATPPVAGTALLAGDEVVQLTAFAEEHAGWIRRPSQRR